jgi:hypothetical protein
MFSHFFHGEVRFRPDAAITDAAPHNRVAIEGQKESDNATPKVRNSSPKGAQRIKRRSRNGLRTKTGFVSLEGDLLRAQCGVVR